MGILGCVAYNLPYTSPYLSSKAYINKMGVIPFFFYYPLCNGFLWNSFLRLGICKLWFICLYSSFRHVMQRILGRLGAKIHNALWISPNVAKNLEEMLAYWPRGQVSAMWFGYGAIILWQMVLEPSCQRIDWVVKRTWLLTMYWS